MPLIALLASYSYLLAEVRCAFATLSIAWIDRIIGVFAFTRRGISWNHLYFTVSFAGEAFYEFRTSPEGDCFVIS